jgi:hypothetical protein
MGAILFSGGLLNEREGYSATMPFFGHDFTADPKAISYASVGMMIGKQDPMMGFPVSAWFTPYVTLRNTTSRPLAVAGTFNYMAGGKPVSLSLPLSALNPYETRRLDFADLLEKLGLSELSGEANLLFSFKGRAGDLVLWTGSVDQTANFIFTVEPQGVGESFGKASGYWTVANGFDTMYTVFNPTDRAEDIVATFHHGDGSGKYELPVHLEAKASKTLDLMDLIEAQRPDARGKVIPMTMRNGGVVFESAEGEAKWMTLVVSAGVYNAHRATCYPVCIECYGYSNFQIEGSGFSVAVTLTNQLKAKAQYSNGSWSYFTTQSSWSSTATSIMTVNNSSSKGLVTGVFPGTATIYAQFPSVITFTGTVCAIYPDCPQGTPKPGKNGTSIPFLFSISPSRGLIGGTTSVTLGGSGFGTSPTVSAGSGITFSYTSRNNTQIVANFVVASNAPSGDHAVTVTAGGQTSSHINFYVQVPTSLSIVPGTNVAFSEAPCQFFGMTQPGCGMDRTFDYQILDQAGQAITGPAIASQQLWDSFGTFSPDPLGVNNGIFFTTCTPAGMTNSGPCNVTVGSQAGQFREADLGICSSVCLSNNTCVTGGPSTGYQTYHIGPYSIAKQIKYYCDHILSDGQ